MGFSAVPQNHENPTTLDSASLRPEFARPSGSGRIFRMPKIENSFNETLPIPFHFIGSFLSVSSVALMPSA